VNTREGEGQMPPPQGSSLDLDQSLRELPLPTPPPIGGELAAELDRMAPAEPRRPWIDFARVFAVSLVYGAALLAYFTLRRDLHGLPRSWVIGYGLAWLVGFSALSWAALVPPRGGVMPRWRAAGIGAVLASVVFVIAGLVFHESGPGSVHLGLAHVARGYRCLELGVASALVPVVLGALFLRGALPVGARWAAAGLGAAGGSLGGLVLHLHCPIADGWHVGLIHGGVVGISAILAAALAPRAMER